MFPLLVLLAQPVGLAPVVVVDDLEPEVGVALDEGAPDVRDGVAPPAAEYTVHAVLDFVVLEPVELFEPARPEAATFTGSAGGSVGGAIRLAGSSRSGGSRRRAHHLLLERFFGGGN